MHENYKKSAPGRTGILACVIGRTKKVAASESREIALVAYFGQITIIRSGRTQKLKQERSQEGRDISVRGKGCHLRIAQNRTCTIFRPNNEYWKQSRAKIINGVIPGGSRYYRAR